MLRSSGEKIDHRLEGDRMIRAKVGARRALRPRARRRMMRAAALLSLLLLAASPAQAQIGGFERLPVPQIAGHPVKSDPTIMGYLFKPAGAGPFATALLMHGCDGLGWATPQRTSWKLQRSYAERYVAEGYAALVLDSFAPRRLATICGDAQRVTAVQRAWDAFAAADLLVARGVADPARLVLQGDSHGGYTVLVALEQGRFAPPHRFAAGIAFYPSCDNATHFARGFAAPLLILIGDADDWTPAPPCRALADRLRQAPNGAPLRLDVFPGATHAFDFPLPARVNKLGHHMAYDAAATAASLALIDRFLAEQVPR
jgi:dienelactone hydrolase